MNEKVGYPLPEGYVECPLHGYIAADHRCGDSPCDHSCAYSALPDAEPDQGTPHRQWSGIRSAQIHRISLAHRQDSNSGVTSGYCAECDRAWPCPTFRMANGQIDPFSGEWESGDSYTDDEPNDEEGGQWSALEAVLAYKQATLALRDVDPDAAATFETLIQRFDTKGAVILPAHKASSGGGS